LQTAKAIFAVLKKSGAKRGVLPSRKSILALKVAYHLLLSTVGRVILPFTCQNVAV
jgi:hypothetical protein